MLPQFTVHSTFRDMRGQQALPHGLEWNLAGESFVAYVSMPNNNENDVVVNGNQQFQLDAPQDTPQVRKAIVNAHNRWCFAKDLPFKSIHDIDKLSLPKVKGENTSDTIHHYYVKWKDTTTPNMESSRLQEASKVLTENAKDAKNADCCEVWINGVDCGMKLHPETLSTILEKVEACASLNLSVKQQFHTLKDTAGDSDQPARKTVRVERYFRGGLRRKQDIFDHIVDNLYALEDVRILQDNDKETTIIGTATLPDWIMGGDLTSRLYTQIDKMKGDVLFLRPLYNDDLGSVDRRFRLKKGVDDEMIAAVKKEVDRLCFLAKLPLPYPSMTAKQQGNSEESIDVAPLTDRERQHRRNRRGFFGT
ncbi:MAG: hypothetical protein SGILL_005028 [Bacillariaceae sp.]